MKKGIKKALTLGLVGLTIAGATIVPVSAAEKQNDKVVYEESLQVQPRAIASFRTFKVGDGTWAVRLTGMPTQSKHFKVFIVRGTKSYMMKSITLKGSSVALSGGMKEIYDGTNLVKIKAGDKLRVEIRDTISAKLIYNVTTSAKY